MTEARPRLLHVVATLDTGGSESWALRLLRNWHGALDQHVVALDRASGTLEATFRALAPLEVVSDSAGAAPSFGAIYRAVRAAARTMRADAVLIHCFGLHQIAAALAARSVGITNVACSAGNPPPRDGRGRAKWRAVIALSRLVGCPVAGCSHTVHAQLAALGVGMPRGSFAIPPGIDLASVAGPSGRDAPPRVAMVARLDAIKDHRTLIEAFALVSHHAMDARLVIIGDGPLRSELEALVAARGIADRVDFLGRRSDVADLLRDMTVFAFSTTRDEGFGIVLIEAMAAGLPIVASDVPACREVLDGGTAGLLVPPGDPTPLAEAILTLLGDPATAADYGARGRARVAQEYGIAMCAERWLAILKLGRP